MRRILLSLMALAVLPAARTASAVVPSRLSDDASIEQRSVGVTRVASPSRALELSARPAWRAFRARYGDWRAIWNDQTSTPHFAAGRGIPLAGFAPRAPDVDAALRAFIAGHPEAFGTPGELRTAAATFAGHFWHVRYQQTVHGAPLLFADIVFTVTADGRLVSFGDDVYAIPDDTPTHAVLPAAVARERAKVGLSFVPGRDRVESAETLYLVPKRAGDATEFRLVYDVRVHVADPPGNWITLVDATDGEVLWRLNRVRQDIGGSVSGLVHPLLPDDVLQSRPFAHLTVSDGSHTTVTDATGAYSLPSTGSVSITAQLKGQFVDVNRSDGADASFSAPAVNPATVNIAWSTGNAQDSERDAFYHVNVAHDYATDIDPGFTGNDYAMPCAVNIAQTCNAFWDGNGVNFYSAGGGCVNTATIADVVYHEYGHGVNDNLYLQAGAAFGLTNGALHEGLADVNAAFIRDDPVIGRGFFGPGSSIRTIDNTKRYPDDLSGDPHLTGLIVAGAMWDLRQSIGLSLAGQLAHFAKYDTPDDDDDGIAMSEYFVAVLSHDDDDANLSNGTPHSADIIGAFNAHGIGTGFYIQVAHTPLADQPSATPYPVTADIVYSGPFGALDPGAVTLHYSINGGAFQSVGMPATGNPDEFSAMIPGQSAAIVRYYIEAQDQNGGTALDPPTAPLDTHAFIAGATVTVIDQPLESNPGWVIGAVGDAATTGIWVWGDPVGSYIGVTPVQPDDDHTFAGVNCYVTGNALPGDAPGTNDVDGGRTTLTTTTFDATTAGNARPLIEYWKWYSNDQGGAPASDPWTVKISNDDGATWAVVESTFVSSHDWSRVVFLIDDFVPPTSTMKLRFVATDEGSGSLVEAAIDDLRVLDFPGLLAVEPQGPIALALSAPAPNPFGPRTTFHFALPRAGRASVHVYDVHGRMVRTLADGPFAAGRHDAEWDGRDARGGVVASGIYFVRLRSGEGEVVRTVARLR